jgi:hypothetical protein
VLGSEADIHYESALRKASPFYVIDCVAFLAVRVRIFNICLLLWRHQNWEGRYEIVRDKIRSRLSSFRNIIPCIIPCIIHLFTYQTRLLLISRLSPPRGAVRVQILNICLFLWSHQNWDARRYEIVRDKILTVEVLGE